MYRSAAGTPGAKSRTAHDTSAELAACRHKGTSVWRGWGGAAANSGCAGVRFPVVKRLRYEAKLPAPMGRRELPYPCAPARFRDDKELRLLPRPHPPQLGVSALCRAFPPRWPGSCRVLSAGRTRRKPAPPRRCCHQIPRPAGVESARLRRFRARRLHAERRRLPLRAHDRGGRCIDPAAAL